MKVSYRPSYLKETKMKRFNDWLVENETRLFRFIVVVLLIIIAYCSYKSYKLTELAIMSDNYSEPVVVVDPVTGDIENTEPKE